VLKFLFWSLLSINIALFAYSQGYLGNVRTNEHEPARMKNQMNADKLTLVSSAQAGAALARATTPAKVEIFACTEVGNFTAPLAKRFEALVGELELGERQTRQNISGGGENATHIVLIPPLGSKEAADKKAGELKQLGVTNFFIMGEDTTMKWAISLGVFKSEAAAQKLLAALQKQGVHSARITSRGGSGSRVVFRFRDLDQATRAKLELIKADFPAQDMRDCAAAPAKP
jgi:hypothetical protein